MRRLVFNAIFLIVSLVGSAQEDGSENAAKGKYFAGGSFGLSVGRFTFINVSPQAGYRFSNFFSAGLGANLIYTSNKELDAFGNDFRKTVQGIAGLNVFARFYPVQKIVIQLQPEANYIFGNVRYYQPPAAGRYKLDAEIIPSMLIGGGIVMPTSNGSLLTTVMIDLLQHSRSPYGNRPVLNVGYNFNF